MTQSFIPLPPVTGSQVRLTSSALLRMVHSAMLDHALPEDLAAAIGGCTSSHVLSAIQSGRLQVGPSVTVDEEPSITALLIEPDRPYIVFNVAAETLNVNPTWAEEWLDATLSEHMPNPGENTDNESTSTPNPDKEERQ